MANYYVWSSGDNSTGASWATAWTSLQTAADTVTAGNTVYCRGTLSPSVRIDFDTNKGSYGSRIRYVGCNASDGSVDGSRFILDFGSNTCNGLYFIDADHVCFYNFEVKSAVASGTYHGMEMASSASSYMDFVNCYVHGWTGYGIYANLSSSNTYMQCEIFNNDAGGSYKAAGFHFASRYHGNGGDGLNMATASSGSYINNCLFYENTADGVSTTYGHTYMNCAFHGNTGSGLYANNAYSPGTAIGCRFTNNGAYGIREADGMQLYCCYLQGNSSGDLNGTPYIMTQDGDGQYVTTGGSDTDYGYVDTSTDDYNLAESATYRAVPITLR